MRNEVVLVFCNLALKSMAVLVLYKVLKISGVYMIHKSYGRDSGRCGAFTTAVLQQTITTLLLFKEKSDLLLSSH